MTRQFNELIQDTPFYLDGIKYIKKNRVEWNAYETEYGELIHIDSGTLVRVILTGSERRATWLRDL